MAPARQISIRLDDGGEDADADVPAVVIPVEAGCVTG
jgi:hypothetical protein